MKTSILLGIALILSLQLSAQKVNDKVQVEYNGSWHDATIKKVNSADGEYFITYDGWSDSWDEWVTIDRLKGHETAPAESASSPLTKFKIGDKVEAEYGMIFEPASIIEVGENKYHIEYHNKLFGDKWLKESQIRKL